MQTLQGALAAPTVIAALDGWYEAELRKQAFINKNQDIDSGTPRCGWADWDENMADFNQDLAAAGEQVVLAIREETK